MMQYNTGRSGNQAGRHRVGGPSSVSSWGHDSDGNRLASWAWDKIDCKGKGEQMCANELGHYILGTYGGVECFPRVSLVIASVCVCLRESSSRSYAPPDLECATPSDSLSTASPVREASFVLQLSSQSFHDSRSGLTSIGYWRREWGRVFLARSVSGMMLVVILADVG
ncbi:hypothetical protein SAY87_028585 [Trapa incisa]|uniref:Uncharacterized protein n=1 Tax=Trapa incisa TaxID=236973 RepID=A0AAN7QQ80_9MYRT|nr:hypothetical protein SAY87_028585 [Trapa incisa]